MSQPLDVTASAGAGTEGLVADSNASGGISQGTLDQLLAMTAPTEEPPAVEKTPQSFTPDDVNRIVKERLAKQRGQYGGDPSEVKQLRTEFEKLKQSQLSESEKALSAAEARGYEKARLETAVLIATAKIETALTGIVDNPGEIVSELNLSRYVSPEGTIDEEAVANLRNRYINLVGKKQPAAPRVGHGRTSPVSASAAPVDQFAAAMDQFFNR
jgi:hypothetical protein